jgi:hypothetical protein
MSCQTKKLILKAGSYEPACFMILFIKVFKFIVENSDRIAFFQAKFF